MARELYSAEKRFEEAKANGASNTEAYDLLFRDIAKAHPEHDLDFWANECTHRAYIGKNGGTMYGVVNAIMNGCG